MHLDREFVDEQTAERLVLRIRPWNRVDLIYGLPAVAIVSVVLSYIGLLTVTKWRYVAFLCAFWAIGFVIFTVWDMFHDIVWIFDRSRGMLSVLGSLRLLILSVGTIVCLHKRPIVAAMCKTLPMEEYPLQDLRGAEVEERTMNAHHTSMPFYRVTLILGETRVPLRGVYEADRNLKDRLVTAIDSFLSARLV